MTQDYIKQRVMVFQGNSKEQLKNKYFFFCCENEKTPYDFMQKDPLNLNEFIEDFSIEEVELFPRDDKTQLTEYRKLARDLSL